MDQMDLAGKAVSGGLFAAGGALLTTVINAWVARRKDSGEQRERRETHALDAVVNGNRQLMDSLLQTVKQLDEQLRLTRTELSECENKHRDADARAAEADMRIAELERLLAVKPKRAAAASPSN
jgi:phage shock protein A